MIALVLADDADPGQAEFHRAAGFEVVPPEREPEAAWLVRVGPGEYWWPRGASAADLLAAVPSRFGVVYGVRRTAAGAELRPVVRPGGRATSLRGWYPFDVLTAPTEAIPGPRRSLEEEVALAVDLDAPAPTERERLDAIEARLARVEVGLVAKLRWKLTHGRRAHR
jgi:hypothetical protein